MAAAYRRDDGGDRVGSAAAGRAREGGWVSFAALIWHNVTVKKLRLTLTALAVAIGVLAVVSLSVVTHSLETSDLALLKTGQADFTIAQKGVSDLLSSSIDAETAARIQAVPGVERVTGVLIGTQRLNAANPQFLEIGIDPADLTTFGVTVVAGRPFAASATNQVLLGWRAAQNLGLHVGDTMRIVDHTYRIVGIYSTGQALGDAGVMLPLAWFQTYQRQPSQYTLLFVIVAPRASIPAAQARIDSEFPEVVTIRTLQQFGRADRSLSLILAADSGATILAVIIGAIVVLSAMTMSFIERTREFGVLSAVGWSPWRVGAMIMSEAFVTGLIGTAAGLALSVLAVLGVQHLPSLQGVLHPVFTSDVFARALYTAAAMVFLGGLVPAIRAATAPPLEALRHE
jgi:putative ABC transport system permease protein